MATVTVLHKQTFLDLSIEKTGTIENVVAFAFANTMSITDPLVSGMDLKIPEGTIKKSVADYYKAYSIQPATAINTVVEDILENNDPCNLCKCFT